MMCSHIRGLLLLIALFVCVNGNAQKIRTIAGNSAVGTATGGNGGPAINAALRTPYGVAVDKKGNVYVSDQDRHVVRKIKPDGTIVAFAGTTLGYSGEGVQATTAMLQSPAGLACDAIGNVYIADAGNTIVRKVDTLGFITTIAGMPNTVGTFGDGGPATDAHIGSISGLSFDTSGNLYIANGNDRVWKVNTSGIITTFAGGSLGYGGNNGPATAASVDGVVDVYAAPNGNVYFSDASNQVVRKVNPAGTISVFAGTPNAAGTIDNVTATAGKLNNPGGIKMDAAGNMYICDVNSNRIRKVNTAGVISTYVGPTTGTVPSGYAGDGLNISNATRFQFPTSLCFDTKGRLYITDKGPGGITATGIGRRVRQIFTVETFHIAATPGTSVCAADTVTFTANVPAYYSQQYHWRKNGVAVAGVNTPIYRTLVANNDRIACTVTDTINASPSATITDTLAMSDTVVMTVIPSVTPTISIINTADTVCAGTAITLNANITNGGTIPAIQWQVMGAGVAMGTGYSYIPANGDTVSAILTSNVACATINPVRASRVITVNPLPFAGAVSGVAFVCPGGSATFASSGNTGGTWGASNTSASVSSAGIVTGNSTGTDTISYMVNTATCGSDTATATITIGAQPVAGHISGLTSVCPGSSIMLTNPASGGTWSVTNGRATINASGVVTGVAAGLDTVVYTVTNTCGTAYDSLIVSVGVSSLHDAGLITGPSTVCAGSTIALADTATGGSWFSSHSAIATVGATGSVSGVTAGADTIFYVVTSGCNPDTAFHYITVIPLLSAGSITGLSAACVGTSITLSTTATGGAWSSSNATVASVDASGHVSTLAAGSTIIKYGVGNSCGSDTATHNVTVLPLAFAASISGAATVCAGSAIILTDTATGGTWRSTRPLIASVSTAGIVSALSAGIDTILYVVTNSCNSDTATHYITVIPVLSADTIAGPSVVCIGTAVSLTTAGAGGTWSSSNTAVASIDATGSFTASAIGTAIISYGVGNACGTDTATHTVTVSPVPFAATITGTSSICIGNSISLTDTASGGTWSSSTATVATVNASGVVTGLAAGSATITYTVATTCGTDVAVHAVSVNPFPTLASSTTPPAVCSGTLFNYTPTSAVAGATFSWTRAAMADIVNPTATSTGDPNEILISTSSSPVSVPYLFSISVGGCATTSTVTVSVKPIPVLSSSNAVSTCAGRTFYYQPASATAGTTYAWTRAAVSGITPITASGSGAINETFTNSGTTSIGVAYVFTLTAAGCVGYDNVAVTVEPQGPPPPMITTMSPSWLCRNTMYQNFGTSTAPDASVVYQWTATNATVWAQGDNHQYSLVNFTSPGLATVYLLTSSVGHSCTSKDSFSVYVDNLNETVVVDYFDGTFRAQDGMATYQWGYDDATTLDSTILAGETNAAYVNSSPDFGNKYYWVITEHLFCKQKSYYTAPVTVGNVGMGGIKGVSVFPNPNTGAFTLNIASDYTEQGTVIVTNMVGSTVLQMPCSTNTKMELSIGQPAGIYFVNVQTPHGKHVTKVVVDRQ